MTDKHLKKGHVRFVLTASENERLQALLEKLHQPVQWAVGGHFEIMARGGMASIAMFPSLIPRLKFRDGVQIGVRLTDDGHARMMAISNELSVSTGYLARVWCLHMMQQFERTEQKEVKRGRVRTALVHALRIIGVYVIQLARRLR